MLPTVTNRKNIFIVFGSIAMFLVTLTVGYSQPTEVMQIPNPGNPDINPITVTVPKIPPSTFYQQLSLKTMSKDEALRIYLQKIHQDQSYDWKVALDFYGKVVDENNQPVPGASARLEWNTIAVPGGTAYQRISSDGNGLFSLTGRCGKVLEVRVEKDGYYTVQGGKGALAFEYADPSSPYWYEPDPNSPVIFHLRKKGEGSKLFSKTLTVPLNNSHPQDRVNLMQGFIKPDGVLTITTDKSKFLPGNQPFPWTFGLSMSEGGLVETKEQFPFEAPTDGYTSTITLAMTNTDRSVWQSGVKKTYYFYLPSTNTYGRLTVDTSSSLPFVSLNYVYNLIPGNRVLEQAEK
jgi:hypothetical protein